MALVSIVIPAHNAELFLAATLDSILAQSHAEWECVIVDDGSTDGTGAIAARYAEGDERIRTLGGPRRGVSAARNAGFRASNPAADYTTFMDSDDVWVPGALHDLLARAGTDTKAIGAHGLAEFIDETGTIIRPGEFSSRGRHRRGVIGRRIVEVPLEAPTDFSVLLFGTGFFPPGVAVIKRRAYVEAGPFDESLAAGEDWEMLVRLSRFGPISFLNEIVVLYRRHSENAGAKGTAPEEVHRALCQCFHSPLNTPDQQALARRGWRARQRLRMAETVSEAWSSRREPKQAAVSLVRCGAAATRYAVGSPRPVIRKPAPTWD